MASKALLRVSAARLKAAENGHSHDNGTALANYSDTPSCTLAPPVVGRPGTWGGARNRASRISNSLTDKQVAALSDAAAFAFSQGLMFQRHWTIHYGKAGIEADEGARFVSHVLAMVAKQARREGGNLTALWVRERASDKGEHVHILMHIPTEMRLHGRTRRWIQAAGGVWAPGVSRVRVIGGRLSKIEENREGRYLLNAMNVVRYFLKGSSAETGLRIGLPRSGQSGRIIGKRCGWTQNIGQLARNGGSEHFGSGESIC